MVQSFYLQCSLMVLLLFSPSLNSNGVPVVPNPGWVFIFTGIISMVTGTLFLMWLGERITERGIGNGISYNNGGNCGSVSKCDFE